MSKDTWLAVDRYLEAFVSPDDDALTAALRASDAAGLPQIAVSPLQGKLLHLLAQTQGARRILEVGTLGGYSTIWLARALPAGGRLVTLELEARHAEVARRNLAGAGVGELARVIEGPALASLDELIRGGEPAFDFVFIDADKPNNPNYFDRAMALTRPGSVIVVDNVVRQGQIADPASTDARVEGSRQLFAHVQAEPRVSATVIQTVGAKGYDGFLLARRIA
ncbi:MAG TPA: O-methyltransferase [Kofleriaceae bacterium]